MRIAAFAFSLLLCAPVFADNANVGKASELLDFDVPQRGAGLDIDGDGQISRAEAAGNAEVTLAFDRADRNRNGKLSTAEWQRYEKWQEQRAKAREARLARSRGSASAGATAPRKSEKKSASDPGPGVRPRTRSAP